MDWLMDRLRTAEAERDALRSELEAVALQSRVVGLRLTALEGARDGLQKKVNEGLEVVAAQRDCLAAEVARLKKLLDRDHTGLAAALNHVLLLVGQRPPSVGWGWLATEDEWGCYEEHERTEAALRAEVGRCFDEVAKTAELALRESGVRADAAFRPEKDEIARLEAACAIFEKNSADAVALWEQNRRMRAACQLLVADAERRFEDFDFDAWRRSWAPGQEHPAEKALKAGRAALAEPAPASPGVTAPKAAENGDSG